MVLFTKFWINLINDVLRPSQEYVTYIKFRDGGGNLSVQKKPPTYEKQNDNFLH